jgi:hypothetical protein
MAGGRLPGAEIEHRAVTLPKWLRPSLSGTAGRGGSHVGRNDRGGDRRGARGASRRDSWDTEVTLSGAGHLLTQVYASALSVAYSAYPASLWARLTRLVLEGAYEATLRTAALNAERTGNNTVYLTLRRRGVRKRHGVDHRGSSVRPVGVFSLSPRRCRGQLPTVESTGVDADRWRLMICYTDPLVWQPLFPYQGVGQSNPKLSGW